MIQNLKDQRAFRDGFIGTTDRADKDSRNRFPGRVKVNDKLLHDGPRSHPMLVMKQGVVFLTRTGASPIINGPLFPSLLSVKILLTCNYGTWLPSMNSIGGKLNEKLDATKNQNKHSSLKGVKRGVYIFPATGG
ncbi:MAG: hypothetical protein QXF49_07600 [Thermosphaera sp.]